MVGELTVTNKFLATLGAGIPIVDTNYITVLKYMKIQEAFLTIPKLGGAKVERWTVRQLSDLIPVRGRSSEGEAGRDGGIFLLKSQIHCLEILTTRLSRKEFSEED